MSAKMMAYDVKLLPERVASLRKLAHRLSYQSQDDQEVTWAELVRRGVDLLLAVEGEHVPTSPESINATNEETK